MKNILYSGVALLAASALLSGCSDNIGFDDGGEGRVFLKTKISTDLKVISRAAAENAELAANTTIWISGSKGAVRKYQGIDEVPADGIQLVAGNYVAEAWTGDSVAASFDTRWFKGREEFTITDNSVTQVDLVCYIANSVVSLTYDDAVSEVLTDCSFEIGHNGGKLTFDKSTPADAKGYFMMSSYDKDLTYTLTATRTDGKGTFTKTGVIPNAKPTTEYAIRIKHDGSVVEPIGGAFITIEVDETPLAEVNDVFELTSAPLISGIGFDISKPVIGSENAVDSKSVWVAATSSLTDVNVTCPTLMAALGLQGNGFEVKHLTDDFKASLANAGISWLEFSHADTGFEEVKLIFDTQALSKLPKGDHEILIEAVDASGRTSSATMTVKVSDAFSETVPLAENALSTYATSATIVGRVLRDGVSRVGFKYAKAGSSDWTQVYLPEGVTYASGDEFTLELTGLTPATRYEYRAIADDMEAPASCFFTTEAAPQLPNASFEEWQEGMPTLIYGAGQPMFWDSGNKGSKTANVNLTTPSEDYKHSGKYSARLASQNVIIAFAAGNLFVGEFLDIEGLSNGILGWGRPFTARPKALRGYIKYTPETVIKGAAGLINKGDMDRGIIYMALVDGSTQSYGKYSGWPQIVATKDIANHSFNKNGANVIAYGEKIFTEATPGSDMVMFEIPLDYKRTDVHPSNIILTISASQYGDYYAGGPSVMYIDDLELVY